MSSSSATAADSRSPSPHTPDPSDSSQPVVVQADIDAAASWFIPMHHSQSKQPPWGSASAVFPPHKLEDDQILRIDDLLEQHAFDEYASSYRSLSPSTTNLQSNQVVPDFRPANLLLPSNNGVVSAIKPVPPPASLPRKFDSSSHNQRVVNPPKETCFNLPIMFPSIPEGGTKSRVETQVRVTVDLADASSSSDPLKYDRVGSWKWLRLPPGTSTKRRTRKQGKIDADPQDTLNLITEIVCASAPNVPVVSCSSCRVREAKRVAKKIAARVRPVRSDSESAGEDVTGKPARKTSHEDTDSIIQFNCAEVLDFSTGSVVLPLRITCYCRHHREKMGFLVRFTMTDHVGRMVGTGVSRPIMITDDHKTASASSRQADYVNMPPSAEPDWPYHGKDVSQSDIRGPSRRKDRITGGISKKRPKPYDSATKHGLGSREGSVSSMPSPTTPYSPLPTTRSPTPSVLQNLLISQGQPQTPGVPALQHSLQSSDTSSPEIISTPLDHNSDVSMPEMNMQLDQSSISLSQVRTVSSPMLQQPQPQPLIQPTPAMLLSQAQAVAPMPFLFFEPNQGNQNLAAMQVPIIHRLIPNMGPTFGGIEVTVLGVNFHVNLNLRCIFGDSVATPTQRWSDNTLVCLLPPQAQPGAVRVWFEGMPEQPTAPPSIFTYLDESDRALMELALQVVGLKMTGKVEDARNVAMRIVGGNTGNDGSDSNGSVSNLMQLASTPAGSTSFGRDLRSLLYIRAGETENFESTVLNFLSVLDAPLEGELASGAIATAEAISHPTTTGQTLLHLAAFMKLTTLVQFLVNHDADIDVRDRNGFTALHFASLVGAEECARILVRAGADREIVNSLGKTAEEIATPGLFDGIIYPGRVYREEFDDGDEGDVELEEDDEEGVEWGDVEEDRKAEETIRSILRKRTPKHISKKGGMTSGHGTPKRSVHVSRAATPPVAPLFPEVKSDNMKGSLPKDVSSLSPPSNEKATADVKQTASLVEVIQRTFAQLPPAAGIIPNLPSLTNIPKPQFPNLPDFGSMPWNSLPQIPMIFPVFVPMPAWPSFLGGSDGEKGGANGEDFKAEGVRDTEIPSVGEWKAVWEKWLTLVIATTARQQQQGQVMEDMPPPEYTPRAQDIAAEKESGEGKGKAKASSPAPAADISRGEELESLREISAVQTSSAGSSRLRPHSVGYDDAPLPAEEVKAYTYRPSTKQKLRRKKYDCMLLMFWLPILFLSLIWASYNGLRFTYITLRTTLPLRALVRGGT
ncbi:hypothetical protein AGABI2DRAFT_220937 [Agaricus bisporus var. bisporus H97]|uniref:hypothetical protein n=1 Tax=Agaricus bisporus var. bisporus (strain H97 / ATCC MYA-4626 / FGSC 10389) TaxID=936046 RepID=UPI00029F5CA3|nr:hypothetical protein AGABI2DRAFT_220937 [Agaricus bisporus var. bisporus H97]EKV47113.1 hypothetical protein AGABI2DRAFT_220937 [Agaricus bisporus var. bisporus H97]